MGKKSAPLFCRITASGNVNIAECRKCWTLWRQNTQSSSISTSSSLSANDRSRRRPLSETRLISSSRYASRCPDRQRTVRQARNLVIHSSSDRKPVKCKDVTLSRHVAAFCTDCNFLTRNSVLIEVRPTALKLTFDLDL